MNITMGRLKQMINRVANTNTISAACPDGWVPPNNSTNVTTITNQLRLATMANTLR